MIKEKLPEPYLSNLAALSYRLHTAYVYSGAEKQIISMPDALDIVIVKGETNVNTATQLYWEQLKEEQNDDISKKLIKIFNDYSLTIQVSSAIVDSLSISDIDYLLELGKKVAMERSKKNQ